MNKDLEYYYNNSTSNCCSPVELNTCLSKLKYLSEFSTDEERKIARDNLGVTELLVNLKLIVDAEAIERGDVAWDLEPTKGHSQYVLSSDVLYKEFLKYALKEEVDEKFQLIWQNFLEKINNLTTFTENLNKNLMDVYKDFLDMLRCMLKEEMIPYFHKLHELKKQFEELESLFNKYVKTSRGGVAISDKFGDNDAITVSLKTLTEAINNIYDRLSEYTGELNDKVSIKISPDYVVTEGSCEVTISVHALSDVFEHIKIYVGDLLIIDKENITSYEHKHTIDTATNIKVEAIILGRTYMKEKTIELYYPFFVGGGWVVNDVIEDKNNAAQYNGNLEGRYNITIDQNGKYFFIVIPKSKRSDVGRIHMNGYDIPVEVIEEDEYIIYKSMNTYRAGDYSIYIQNIPNYYI